MRARDGLLVEKREDTVESLSSGLSIKIAKKYSEDTRIMVIKYEDVVGDDQALTLAKLSRFLDVHLNEHLVPGTQAVQKVSTGVGTSGKTDQ